MERVIERAVADRERPLRDEFTLLIDGLQLRVRRRETVRLIDSVHRRRGTHNELRPHLVQRFVDILVARYKEGGDPLVSPARRRRARRERAESLRSRQHARRERRRRAGARRGTARRVGAGAARPHAEPPRGEGGTRPHVARALRPGAGQRSLRLLCTRAVGGAMCSPTTSRRCCTGPEVATSRRSRGPKTTSRSSTRPTPVSARSRPRGLGGDGRRIVTKTSIARHA